MNGNKELKMRDDEIIQILRNKIEDFIAIKRQNNLISLVTL